MIKVITKTASSFIKLSGQVNPLPADCDRRFFFALPTKPTKQDDQNSVASKLLHELMKADAIIKNAQNVMTPHQVQALASLNARDGIVGLHINRHHERRLLISEAKEHYERASKKTRLWHRLFRHNV